MLSRIRLKGYLEESKNPDRNPLPAVAGTSSNPSTRWKSQNAKTHDLASMNNAIRTVAHAVVCVLAVRCSARSLAR